MSLSLFFNYDFIASVLQLPSLSLGLKFIENGICHGMLLGIRPHIQGEGIIFKIPRFHMYILEHIIIPLIISFLKGLVSLMPSKSH